MILLTWNIASTTWVPILPPSSSNPLVFVVDLKIDVAQALGDSDTEVDTRISSANDTDLKWSLVLDRYILKSKRFTMTIG